MLRLKCRLFNSVLVVLIIIAPRIFGEEALQTANPASTIAATRDEARPLAFAHVTVIDVAAKDAHHALKLDQTVVIAGQHIVALGKTGIVKVPEGAQVMDATGKFLIPGLWDMHVHMLDDHWNTTAVLNLFLANGVTGVRDMWSGLRPILALREQIASGSRLGPRMVAAGPALYGVKGEADNRHYISAEEARGEVRRLKQAGVDFIKVYSYLSPEAFYATMDEAKKQGLMVVGHVPFAVKASDAAKAGLKSMEHLEGTVLESANLEDALREEISQRIRGGKKGISVPQIEMDQAERYRDSYNPRKLWRLNALYLKYGTWQCPTLVIPDMVAREKDIFQTKVVASTPYRRYVSESVQAAWNRVVRGVSQVPNLRVYADYKRVLVAEMHRAGVPFLTGTDAPVLGQVPGFSLHDELGLFVEVGFSPLEALRAATLNPARFFGRQNGLGTIARGKLADLVLLDANPLDDIANTRRINTVIVNGRYLPRSVLQTMLADVEAIAAKKSVALALSATILEKGIAPALEQYRELRERHSDTYVVDESEMNEMAYRLLGEKKVNEAIEIFKLNAAAFPASFNVYDSLGEAYMINGDTALAIENYQKSVKLNPDNSNGVEMLKKLQAR